MIVGLFKRKASLLVPWLAFAGIYLLLTMGFVIFFVAKAGQPIEYTIGNQTYDLNKWLNDNLMIPEIQLKQSAQVKSSKMTKDVISGVIDLTIEEFTGPKINNF